MNQIDTKLSLTFIIDQKCDYEITTALYGIFNIHKLTIEDLPEYFEVLPEDQ